MVSSLEASMAALPLCMARLSLWRCGGQQPSHPPLCPGHGSSHLLDLLDPLLREAPDVVCCQWYESDPHGPASICVVFPLGLPIIQTVKY